MGHITVRPSNGENYSQVITVNLTVANATQLTAAPPVLLFSFQIGQTQPASQTIQISSTGAQLDLSQGSSRAGKLFFHPLIWPVEFHLSQRNGACRLDWLADKESLA